MRSIGLRHRHHQLQPGSGSKFLLPRLHLCVLLLAAIAVVPAWPEAAPALPQLTSEQVVQRLMEKNRERAAALQHYIAKRTYHLEYRGFPASAEASMEVEVNFDAPCSKHFTIVSASGSKVIQNRVFRRLLETEEEAGETNNRKSNDLSPENYNFSLAGIEDSNYVLDVEPKVESKFLYRGKIWVDSHDFAVTRIEAQPARNPSFWTTKSLIHHTYQKIDSGFYLPRQNKTVTSVRLGGTATLTIDYLSYQVTAANPVALERKPIARAAGFAWPESGLSESVSQFVSSAK
jgi:hypothetical protein